jgi:hypothetical protein
VSEATILAISDSCPSKALGTEEPWPRIGCSTTWWVCRGLLAWASGLWMDSSWAVGSQRFNKWKCCGSAWLECRSGWCQVPLPTIAHSA